MTGISPTSRSVRIVTAGAVAALLVSAPVGAGQARPSQVADVHASRPPVCRALPSVLQAKKGYDATFRTYRAVAFGTSATKAPNASTSRTRAAYDARRRTLQRQDRALARARQTSTVRSTRASLAKTMRAMRAARAAFEKAARNLVSAQRANGPYAAMGSFTSGTWSGVGDSVIALPSCVRNAIVTSSHKGESNFIVWGLAADNSETGLVANLIGSDGTTQMLWGPPHAMAAARKMQVTADGAWTITVKPVSSAPVLTGSLSGHGGGVFLYGGKPRNVALTHRGESNFIVWSHQLRQFGDVDLLANAIGNHSGTRALQAGPMVVEVQADGDWTATLR